MRAWNIFREHEFRNFVEFERKLLLNFRNLSIMIRNFFFSSFLFSYKRVSKGFGYGCPNLEISATHLFSVISKNNSQNPEELGGLLHEYGSCVSSDGFK